MATNGAGLPIRAVLAALSFGSAAIHASVILEHFGEFWLFGAFFVVVTVLQVVWGVRVLVEPSRRVLVAGAVGNGLLVVLWIVSRTAGVPIGPEPGTAELIGWHDLISTIEELLIVVGVIAVLAAVKRPGSMRPSKQRVPAGIACGAVGLLTLFALASAEYGGDAGGEPLTSRSHLLHIAFLAGAFIVFGAYVVFDVKRNGMPLFSWRLKPPTKG